MAKKIKYTDVSFSFSPHPMNGDVVKKTNYSAINGSINSILKTDYNERLFDPAFGSNIKQLLFAQMNRITEARLKNEIQTALKNFEPRIEVIDIIIDSNYEELEYDVHIHYNMLNDDTEQTFTTILKTQ